MAVLEFDRLIPDSSEYFSRETRFDRRRLDDKCKQIKSVLEARCGVSTNRLYDGAFVDGGNGRF